MTVRARQLLIATVVMGAGWLLLVAFLSHQNHTAFDPAFKGYWFPCAFGWVMLVIGIFQGNNGGGNDDEMFASSDDGPQCNMDGSPMMGNVDINGHVFGDTGSDHSSDD